MINKVGIIVVRGGKSTFVMLGVSIGGVSLGDLVTSLPAELTFIIK